MTPDLFSDESEPVPLPPGYCVELVTVIPPPSLPGLSHLLSSLIPHELEALPRGAISSGLRQSQGGGGSLERAVRGVGPLVQGMCLANSERDSHTGMVASKPVLLALSLLRNASFKYVLCKWCWLL